MGIDNDSKLVFGIILTAEQVEHISSIAQEDEYDEWFCIPPQEFDDLFFGYASPWYDCGSENYVYFVSITEPENCELSIAELDNWNSYLLFLKFADIEPIPPRIYSLPHIW